MSHVFGKCSRAAGLRTSVALIAMAVPVTAFAQDGAEVAEEAYGNEIVVTATKREQTLQDVPVAVSVTTAETIQRAQIRDIKDLSSVVPSLRVNQLQSSANTNFYIRGFGNGANNAGIEPSVGLFIDGAYRSRSAAMITDLPDLERVEVLRGPQSTLFGKNASAGVISITTRKPQFDFGGTAEAAYGNFNAMVLKGMVTGPLSESVAVSVSGSWNKRDGYVRDLGTGNRTNERDRWSLRGQVLFAPGDDLEVRLVGDYGKIDENCCAAVNVRAAAPTAAIFALGGQVNPASDPFADVVYNNFDSTNKIKNWGGQANIDYDLGGITLASITSYRGTDALTNQDSDFSSLALLGRNYQDLSIRTFTQELRANAELTDSISALIGGFYFSERIKQSNQVLWGTGARSYFDLLVRGQTGGAQSIPALEGLFGTLSGNPALFQNRFFAAGQGLDERYRLKNDAWSIFGQVDAELTDRLTISAGLNYTRDKKRFSANATSSDVYASLSIPTFVTAATNAGIAQTIGGLLQVPGGFANAAQIGAFAAANPAGFAQIQAGAAAATAPLLGLRAIQIFPPFLNVPNAVEPGKLSDGDFSYALNVSYEATDAISVYARYATGYKAASVNLSRDARPTPADLVAINQAGIGVTNLSSGSRFAGAEDSTLYEAGIKADWKIATANFAVFKQVIKGFQSNIFTGTGFFLANAGKQSVFGVEFEGMFRPTDPLTLTLAVTYLDGKYDSFNLSAFGDLSGTVPAGFSPLSATIGAQWSQDLGGGDRLILRGDYHYEAPFKLVEGLPNLVAVSGVAGALAAARDFKQEINDVNASLTYAMDNGLEVSLWGRNLLDDRSILQIFDSPAQQGSISGYLSQPRTYGVSARFSW